MYKLGIENVATVNGVGEIIAKNPGNTTIIATTTNGIQKKIKVTVAELTIKRTGDCSLLKGDTISCRPTIYIGKKKRKDIKIAYKTNNVNVATVTANGTIKGVGVGSTNIYVYYLGSCYSINVKVVNKLSKPVPIAINNDGYSWSHVDGAEGYQIQYSTSTKFKKAKTIKVKAKNGKYEYFCDFKKIMKLKKDKKYYIRVRAYAKVGKKTKYSAWSKKNKLESEIK